MPGTCRASIQKKKLLQRWLAKIDFEEDVTVLKRGGQGKDASDYMYWGGLQVRVGKSNKIVRLNMFHIGEDGITESAQLLALETGVSCGGCVRGVWHPRLTTDFIFEEGSLSNPIRNADDLRREISYYVANNGNFSNEELEIHFERDEKGYPRVEEYYYNIHPRPDILDTVLEMLLGEPIDLTDVW